jgi:hypothetical protein
MERLPLNLEKAVSRQVAKNARKIKNLQDLAVHLMGEPRLRGIWLNILANLAPWREQMRFLG